MGKICESGLTCDCPPKPCIDGEEFRSAEWERDAQEKWELDHSGHLNAPAARLDGALFKYGGG